MVKKQHKKATVIDITDKDDNDTTEHEKGAKDSDAELG